MHNARRKKMRQERKKEPCEGQQGDNKEKPPEKPPEMLGMLEQKERQLEEMQVMQGTEKRAAWIPRGMEEKQDVVPATEVAKVQNPQKEM